MFFETSKANGFRKREGWKGWKGENEHLWKRWSQGTKRRRVSLTSWPSPRRKTAQMQRARGVYGPPVRDVSQQVGKTVADVVVAKQDEPSGILGFNRYPRGCLESLQIQFPPRLHCCGKSEAQVGSVYPDNTPVGRLDPRYQQTHSCRFRTSRE